MKLNDNFEIQAKRSKTVEKCNNLLKEITEEE